MDKKTIEMQARAVQIEIWRARDLLWPLGVPRPEVACDPMVIADYYGLNYQVRDWIGSQGGVTGNGFEAAGLIELRADRTTIAVSSKFSYAEQRFTAAHEIGHYVLHREILSQTTHRDRPVSRQNEPYRSTIDQEADYFGACLLINARLLEAAFVARFGTRKPLPRNEVVAFHLGVKDLNGLFSAPRGSSVFGSAVARAQSFNGRRFKSLADHFNASPSAIAIRLRETGLIVD